MHKLWDIVVVSHPQSTNWLSSVSPPVMPHLPPCRFPLYILHTRPQYERATNLPRFIRVVPGFLAAADEWWGWGDGAVAWHCPWSHFRTTKMTGARRGQLAWRSCGGGQCYGGRQRCSWYSRRQGTATPRRWSCGYAGGVEIGRDRAGVKKAKFMFLTFSMTEFHSSVSNLQNYSSHNIRVDSKFEWCWSRFIFLNRLRFLLSTWESNFCIVTTTELLAGGIRYRLQTREANICVR
jgi:hypothetical protein